MEEQALREVNLRDIVAFLKRRLWIILLATAAGACGAALVAHNAPRVYQAKSQIQIKTPEPDAASVAAGLPFFDSQKYKATELALFENPSVAAKIADVLKLNGIRVSPSVVSGSLSVQDRRDTDLIDIIARSSERKLAVATANAAAIGFRAYKEEVAKEAAQGEIDKMRDRVQNAKVAMNASSAALAAFQSRYHLFDLPKQTEGQMNQYGAIEMAAEEAARDLQSAESSASLLKEELAKQNHTISSYGARDNKLIEDLNTQLADEKSKLRDARQTYIHYPALIKPLEADVQDTERQLRAELTKVTGDASSLDEQDKLIADLHSAERQVVEDEARLSTLNRQLTQASAGFKDLPTRQREFLRLSQDAEVDRDLYTKSLESFQQMDISRLAHPDVLAITQTATNASSISTKAREAVSVGLVIGLLLGLGLALLIEHLDEAVHTETDLRTLVPDLPVLGVLPAIPSAELVSSDEGLSAASKGPYRSLSANLGFLSMDTPMRSILITSTMPGEGKSLTCAYLARALAEEGKRVVLVDCDLRRPTQHRLFGITDALGFSEVLSGKCTLDEALVATDQPNLRLLTAGKTLPHNPALYLTSERLRHLIDDLQQHADFVIIDSPPCIGVTDALLLAARCQAVLQVVESGRAKRQHILRVTEGVARAHGRHAGLILNKVNKADLGYDGYYYYYYNYKYYQQDGDGRNGNGKGPNGAHRTRARVDTVPKQEK